LSFNSTVLKTLLLSISTYNEEGSAAATTR
jgi:hypothetical protein